MDQIQIARIVALLTVLPPDNEFCKLVSEFATSDSESDLAQIDANLSDKKLRDRIGEAAAAIDDYLTNNWENTTAEDGTVTANPDASSIVQLMVKIITPK